MESIAKLGAVVPEPSEDTDPNLVCEVQMRCLDGSTIRRRFLKASTKVSDLINYYKVEKSEEADI